nr:hypothetical protein GCM10017745_35020 [Saccharothrix mutabilis subsp. capreolus]
MLSVAMVLVPGSFDDPAREGVVLAGLALLLASSRVPLPRPLVGVVSLVASASLYIYLTHYALFPPLLEFFPPAVVVVLSLVGGIAAWRVTRFASRWRSVVFSRPLERSAAGVRSSVGVEKT